MESMRGHRLREEVSLVIRSTYIGYGKLHGLYHVAHIEMVTRYVLGALVELRVERQVARALVCCQLSTMSAMNMKSHAVSKTKKAHEE